MRYLITTKIEPPFMTQWYEFENHFNSDEKIGMIVYDLFELKFSIDGHNWKDIGEDHL